MADKKKMSVADILAAARKSDGSEAGDSDSNDAGSGSTGGDGEGVSQQKPPTSEKPNSTEKPGPVAKPGSADRPNVSDILALARAGKGGGQEAAQEAQSKSQPTTNPAKKGSPATKGNPVKKAKPDAAAGKAKATKGPAVTGGPAVASEPRETASILAAARKSSKSGPVSKAEAASQSKAKPAAKAKPKLVVPPMPTRPAYVTRAMEASTASTAGAAGKKKGGKGKSGVDAERRTFMGTGFWALGGVTTLWTLAVVRFMFPNVLREPPSKFKVGSRDAFSAGQVQTKYKAQYGVWVINTRYHGEQQLVALKSVCTHLGCTPNWLEAEQKFKCPCHGSGFYKDGVNFEGPAPRPLERYAIQISDDGQVEIDKSRTFQEEMGEWSDPACFISV
jgi:cytochrome b6-f complex iron-sulfur subunit